MKKPIFPQKIIACLVMIVLVATTHAPRCSYADEYVRYQEPAYLSFDELRGIAQDPESDPAVKTKMRTFFTTPIISNEAYYNGIKPHRPYDPYLKYFLRLVSWNIEKSMDMRDAIAAFTSREAYEQLLDADEGLLGDDKNRERALQQREKLEVADIVVLQEMEIGIKRSGYRNAARDLAEALHMNYAFAPQYLEVDPVQLGIDDVHFENGGIDPEATSYYSVDPARYKGVFGSAVLSRYPIKSVTLIPLKTQPYDWYEGEKAKSAYVEHARRFGSKIAFDNTITREMKVGGRHFFRVDLAVPDLPEKTLSIINIHLEIKCRPEGRKRQMEEILSYVRDIRNPVIMVGDFNAAPDDLSPTSMKRVMVRSAKNPTLWLSAAVSYLTPQGLAINVMRGTTNVTKNLFNPFAPHVPILAPNLLKPMFAMIRDFQFSDGGYFDPRGDSSRTSDGRDGLFANSNERYMEGYEPTFSVNRSIAGIIGVYRLDWVFVKSYLHEAPASYRFAPHRGETLRELNSALKRKVSDHSPNLVDLPFDEPLV